MQSDMDYMRAALDGAWEAYAEGEIPVGAVVVAPNGDIVGRGHNMREKQGDPLAHAEMAAIRQAANRLKTWRLTACTLYVTLEPCPMCAGAALMSRLSRVVFGAYDKNQGCCGSVYLLPSDPGLSGQTTCLGGILETECAEPLQSFFAKARVTDADRLPSVR